MTTATAEQTETKNDNAHIPSDEDMEKVVTFIANDYLKNATMVDLLSGVPVNTLIQLLQTQAINRSKNAVEGFSEEQFKSALEEANKPPPEPSEEPAGEG